MNKYKSMAFIFNPRALLCLVLGCEIINIAYFAIFFYFNKYLPAPFVWDKDNTFGDFYNPLYWVVNDGFYAVYQSVYPPLSYYFLKIFTWGIESNSDLGPFDIRNNYIGISILVCAIYIGIILIVTNIGKWKTIKEKSPMLIWLACALSTPVLFALERGNLIFIALLLLALYLATENKWLKALFFGLLVNFKPYFVILLIQYINIYKFNKQDLLREVFVAVAIFALTAMMIGLNVFDFVSSFFKISVKGAIGDDGLLALPNNISALYVLKNTLYYHSTFPQPHSTYAFWFSCIKALGIVTPLILFFTIIFRPLTKIESIVSVLVLIASFSNITGGYIYIIYILLIPLIIKTDYRFFIFPLLIIFCLPVDQITMDFIPIKFELIKSYLGGNIELTDITLYLGWGSVLRPLANYFILLTLISRLLRKYPIKFKIT